MANNFTEKIKYLEQEISYNFKNKLLLHTALTHSSFAKLKKNEHLEDNERLEFFGDAILKFIVSEYLLLKNPNHDEGLLTILRSKIVADITLAEIAKKIKLNDYIQISHSERQSGGANKKSILSNSFEALIGAIYLDSSLENIRKFIIDNIEKHLPEIYLDQPISDSKSQLQETLQKNHLPLPKYEIIKTQGPEHEKTFFIEVIIELSNQTIKLKGKGANKKEAEQKAAEAGLKFISKNKIANHI